MDDLISVVIPAYNASKFIGSAIRSVLSQTYTNIEIIIVDDCSTDDTTSILLEFQGKIRVMRHEKNRGAAAARNTGVGQSRGSLIAFLDADDKWAPEKLETFAESFSINKEILFAFSDFSRFDWDEDIFFALSNSQIFPMIYKAIEWQTYSERRCFVIPRKEMFTLLLRGYPIYPSTMVVRKRLFDSVGMWRKVQTNEDFDFSLRTCRATDCIYIDEKLSMIGRHASNASIDVVRQMESDISVFELHMADSSYNKEELDLFKFYKGRRLCNLGDIYLQSGNNKQAVRKYGDALKEKKWFWRAFLKIGYAAVTASRRRRMQQAAAR